MELKLVKKVSGAWYWGLTGNTVHIDHPGTYTLKDQAILSAISFCKEHNFNIKSIKSIATHGKELQCY